MMNTGDLSYFSKREKEERAAAKLANDPAIQDAHFVMAERYADRCWSMVEEDHQQMVKIVP